MNENNAAARQVSLGQLHNATICEARYSVADERDVDELRYVCPLIRRTGTPSRILHQAMPAQIEPGEPIRHHYVPRGYLAPFTHDGTTKRGRVWVYRRDPAEIPRHGLLRDVAF